MTNPTLSEIKNLAYDAGAILRLGYGQNHQLEMKGATDLATEIDQKSEHYLVTTIQKKYPQHTIIAEESGIHQGKGGSRWHIDPLDGTIAFAHGVPMFSVSVAYEEAGEVLLGAVYDPLRDELFYAEKGKGTFLNGQLLQVATEKQLIKSLGVTGFPHDHQSEEMRRGLLLFNRISLLTRTCFNLTSAALNLSYVAAGRLDFYFETRLCSYDVAAGSLFVRESGGVTSRFNGDSNYLQTPTSMVAANPTLHALILPEIQKP